MLSQLIERRQRKYYVKRRQRTYIFNSHTLRIYAALLQVTKDAQMISKNFRWAINTYINCKHRISLKSTNIRPILPGPDGVCTKACDLKRSKIENMLEANVSKFARTE